MSQVCATAMCKRSSCALCHCCNQNVCRPHLNEHQDLLNSQLSPLADQINTIDDQLKAFNADQMKDECRQQLEQWRVDCYRKIDELFELKCCELDRRVAEKLDKRREETDRVRSKVSEHIREEDATRQNLELLIAAVRDLKRDTKQLKQISFHVKSRSLAIDKMIDIKELDKNNPHHRVGPVIQSRATEQLKNSEYSSFEESDDSAPRQNNKQKKTKNDTEHNNRSKSNSTVQSTSDDEDYENTSDLATNHISQSRSALSSLRFLFNDSDDSDDSDYSDDPDDSDDFDDSDNFDDSDDSNDEYFGYLSWPPPDIVEYRHNYPNILSDPHSKDNYDFYMNRISSRPNGDKIDNIHKEWYGDYEKLEHRFGYIKWLFPLQGEDDDSWPAEPLQKHEIESIKNKKKALARILKSYELMLDFYGFELVNKDTGEIRRLSDDVYESRFRNLNTSSHNYLRITRILKCLGEFNYEHFKFPFLEQILRESISENTLSTCRRSCKNYWIETLRDRKERRAIRQYARELIDYRNKGITPPSTFRALRPL